MGRNGSGKRRDVPGCSRMPPPELADERELGGDGSRSNPVEKSPTQEYKRHKTGIQQLAARRAAAQGMHVKATCSSSISKVCALFATFGDEKRAIVEDIDFGGLLRLPRNTEPDPLVSLWLMRSVQTSDLPGLCIHTRNFPGIICRDVDVYLMFGIPFEGAEVALGEPVQTKIVRVVRKLLQISVCSYPISMAELRQVLLKNYGSSLSYAQQASFKIAVVLYAMTHFLAPTCCNPQFANTEILKHLLDTDNIKRVNWAGYVIKCIKREASRLKDELGAGAPSVLVHACPAVLKVFYLDNLGFGSLSPVHDVFPRISAYPSERMCALVAADTKKDYMSSLDMFGITKIREKSDVCYSRGFASRSVRGDAVGQTQDVKTVTHIDDSKISSEVHDMTHFGLKLIDEHAVKCSELLKGMPGGEKILQDTIDYMRSQWISYSVEKQEARLRLVGAMPKGSSPRNRSAMLAGESSSSGSAANRMGSLKVESGKLVLEPTGTPKISRDDDQGNIADFGFWESSEQDGSDQHSVLTPEERAFFATPADPLVPDGPPIYDSTPVSSTRLHGAGGLFAGEAEMAPEEEPQVPDDDYDLINVTSHSVFGSSPFSLGLFHAKACPPLCRHLIKMLDQTDAVEGLRIWFRSDVPTVLALSCADIRSVFYREGRYSVPAVDGLSRSYTTYDKLMYTSNGVLENMWRHWMPASFAVAVIDGEDWLSPRFRDMLVGDHLGYNVANCRMLFMTLPMDGRWCSYVWDFLKKVITVLDPYLQQTEVGRLAWVHDDTMACLHEALFDCIDKWIQGWEVDRHNWRYSHPIALGRRCRDYNSGVYTMHYALHFDGDDVTDLSVEDDHVLARADHLYKLMRMPGNTGDLPAFLRQAAP